MTISESVRPSGTVLRLDGNFTYDSRREFKASVEKARQAGCRNLVVDLGRVNFVDSAALGLLVLTSHQFQQEQRTFSLMRPAEKVAKLLAIANINRIIPVYENEQAAHAA